MRSILAFGALFFALTFCGLGERFRNLQGSSNGGGGNSSSSSGSTTGQTVEKAEMTSEQRSIADAGTDVKWEEQGMSWRLPAGWTKMDVSKTSFNYQSPDQAFLLVNISSLGPSFPVESSIEAYYTQAIQKLRSGDYEKVRYLEIDGLKGVEFIESMPADQSGARRHQWIAYRSYLGDTQQLNVMLSTKGSNFEKHRDTFPAVLYSTTAVK